MANWTGFAAFTFKETWRFLKIIKQTLIAPVVTNGLYLIVFGVVLKDRVIEGTDYNFLQFLVPGLIVMVVISNSFISSCASVLISKYNKTAIDFLIIPLTPVQLTLGFLIASILRGVLVALMTYLVSLFFVSVPLYNPPFIFLTVILISACFGLAGIVTGVKYDDFDELSTIQNFIIMPLVFLGGVFFSINQLPEPFDAVARFNPIAYMINALRYGFLGISDVNIYAAVLIMVFICAALFLYSRKLFKDKSNLIV